MDAPRAAPAPSRPSLLQLLGRLFGLRRSTRRAQEPGARGKGHDSPAAPAAAVPDWVLPGSGELAGQQRPCREPRGDAAGQSGEEALGELREISLEGSLGSGTSRGCPTPSVSDTELDAAGDTAEAPASSPAPAQQHVGSGVAGQEGKVMPEALGDAALETAGLLQGPGAAAEVTGIASLPLMFPAGFDAEKEREQLLKDQGAESPKAELSLWNRLITMNRHRRTSDKPHVPGSLMQLEREEESPLSVAVHGPTAPVLPLLPAKPSGVVPVYRRAPPLSAAKGGSGSPPPPCLQPSRERRRASRGSSRAEVSSRRQMALCDFKPPGAHPPVVGTPCKRGPCPGLEPGPGEQGAAGTGGWGSLSPCAKSAWAGQGFSQLTYGSNYCTADQAAQRAYGGVSGVASSRPFATTRLKPSRDPPAPKPLQRDRTVAAQPGRGTGAAGVGREPQRALATHLSVRLAAALLNGPEDETKGSSELGCPDLRRAPRHAEGAGQGGLRAEFIAALLSLGSG
ncbi:uncharacterized protein LOC135323775 [Dromaius novaehollandiae]|uniref:uncharacterized protein LOC135323775 n=1 Tax=Dromaius novaehollandiae TaxID=8790 RepID=UPI00311EBCDA